MTYDGTMDALFMTKDYVAGTHFSMSMYNFLFLYIVSLKGMIKRAGHLPSSKHSILLTFLSSNGP